MLNTRLLVVGAQLLLMVAVFFGIEWAPDCVAADGVLTRIDSVSNKAFVASGVSEADGVVSFFDIGSYTEQQIDRTSVKEIKSPISADEAAQMVGLPRLISWKASEISKRLESIGKLAKITPQLVYSTLSKYSGVEVGSRLIVFRSKGGITDPDTGEIIGYERAKLAELEVTEAGEQFSKAKVLGNLEVELQVGDEVQQAVEMRVAVCPIQNEDGTLTTVGNSLSEDINNQLVHAGIAVVERSALTSALEELLIQSNALIDQETTVKLGKLAGANVVVVGRIVPKGNTARAYVRILDVATAKILFAASSTVSLRSSKAFQPLRESSAAASVTTFRGSYESGKLSNQSSIQLVQKVSRNYSVTAKFVKYGTDSVVFMLPVSDSNVMVVLDQDYGKLSGLSMVKNSDASQNATRTSVTTASGSNVIQIQVRSNRDRSAITVMLNGKEIVNWKGSTQELSSKDPWIPPDRSKIGIGTTNCTVELISWELTDL